MKYRLMALFMTVALLLTGCAPEISLTENVQQIYASFYPIYALSSLVLDEIPGIRLKCLVQPQDDCLRLYELSDWDASVISYDADCIIIGGNGLESFENTVYSFGSNGPAVISATDSSDPYEYQIVENAGTNTGHLTGKNPDLYMSVTGAMEMVQTINTSIKTLFLKKRINWMNPLRLQ
jgi:ABC-type Zn uptake system ZnuABC Zn-binding protein ZnuA